MADCNRPLSFAFALNVAVVDHFCLGCDMERGEALKTNLITCADLSAVASSPEDSATTICHLQVEQQNI